MHTWHLYDTYPFSSKIASHAAILQAAVAMVEWLWYSKHESAVILFFVAGEKDTPDARAPL